MDTSGLPQTPFMNALGEGPTMNTKNYIVAGPDSMSYWNHSPGFQKPMINSEGPFPIQGNIGSIIVEQKNNFTACGKDPEGNPLPTIGSSPNCSGTFKADIYTVRDTCGKECDTKFPESFGDKDFGFPKEMPWGQKVTNAHQVHAYQNIRAGMPGEGPDAFGAYEWVPRVSANKPTNSFVWDQRPVFQQVGDFLSVPQYSNLRSANFGK